MIYITTDFTEELDHFNNLQQKIKEFHPKPQEPVSEPTILESVPVEPSVPEPSVPIKESSDPTENYSNRMQPVLDKLKSFGLDFKTTSSIRPNAKTASGATSRHALGYAVDVVPTDFKKFKDIIKNNKEFRDWCDDNNIMMYAEDTPEILKKTHGTGNHIHISYNYNDNYEFKNNKQTYLWTPKTIFAKLGTKIPLTFSKIPQGDIEKKDTWDYLNGLPPV